MVTRRSLAIFGACVGALLIWLALAVLFSGRFVYLNAGSGAIYRADRWTGDVVQIKGDKSYRVKTPIQTAVAEAEERRREEEAMKLELQARRAELEAYEKAEAERRKAWAAYKGPKPSGWVQKFLDPPPTTNAPSHPPNR